MSKAVKTGPVRRINIPKLVARKGGQPLVCLTAYTAPMASILDEYCDILLVGDSIGMVIYGMDNTLGVTLDIMIAHGRAVVKASRKSLVVIDMPFGTYEESPEVAFRNCARVMADTGAQAIKLEGGRSMAPTIEFLTRRSIPVMAHIGLMPQSVNTMGGFVAQGRDEAEWADILADAAAVEAAGAFSTVVEGVSRDLGDKIARETSNLIIGIGASAACDGQILVTDDMLGMFDWTPKFVKKFGDLRNQINQAVSGYADAVRSREFPADAQTYEMKSK